MMKKVSSILVSSLSMVWLLSGCVQKIQEQKLEDKTIDIVQYELESFCSTKSYNLSQKVTISDVTAIANHRDGRLLIVQDVNQPDLNMALLKLTQNQDVSLVCMEYLSTNGLMELKNGEDLIARVYFDFDSKKLTPESRIILGKVVEKLARGPSVIKLIGHTDGRGSEAYNYGLGIRRADSVQTYLKNPMLNNTQFKSESRGEIDPIAGNETKEGRKLNRRVEIHVLPLI